MTEPTVVVAMAAALASVGAGMELKLTLDRLGAHGGPAATVVDRSSATTGQQHGGAGQR